MENNLINKPNDDAFLSFLYSERDRENSISQFQGWNNWVLIGAIITISYTVYHLFQRTEHLDFVSVVYYTSGITAVFLCFHNLYLVFQRDRGIDLTKIKLVKEVFPYARLTITLVCSISALIVFPIIEGYLILFWSWLGICVTHLFAIGTFLFTKNRVVPPYYQNTFFSRRWENTVFNLIVSGGFGLIIDLSFRGIHRDFLSKECEIAILVSAIFVLLFLLLVINSDNKAYKSFDRLIDEYLYLGTAKEDIVKKIVRNRMGYGIIDVCKKEMEDIELSIEKCDKEISAMETIKTDLEKEIVDRDVVFLSQLIDKIDNNLHRLKKTTNVLKSTLKKSNQLNNRIIEILKTVPIIRDKTDIETIFSTNETALNTVRHLLCSADDTICSIKGKQQSIRASIEKMKKTINLHLDLRLFFPFHQ